MKTTMEWTLDLNCWRYIFDYYLQLNLCCYMLLLVLMAEEAVVAVVVVEFEAVVDLFGYKLRMGLN